MNVTLVLVDALTGVVIAETEAPITSLPERFARVDTTLTVGSVSYEVVGAEPDTRDAIGRTGSVKLAVRKVEAVDPKQVLFSLPTIENTIPRSIAAPAGVEVSLRIDADDWRQAEFVSRAYLSAIDAELDDVRTVLATKRTGPGFSEIHVRKRIAAPLDGTTVTLDEVEAALGARSRPFAIRGEGPLLLGGFAIPCAEALVYGTALEGHVTTLAVYGLPDDVLAQLHPLAFAQGLVWVDWCRTRHLLAYEEGFGEPST